MRCWLKIHASGPWLRNSNLALCIFFNARGLSFVKTTLSDSYDMRLNPKIIITIVVSIKTSSSSSSSITISVITNGVQKSFWWKTAKSGLVNWIFISIYTRSNQSWLCIFEKSSRRLFFSGRMLIIFLKIFRQFQDVYMYTI